MTADSAHSTSPGDLPAKSPTAGADDGPAVGNDLAVAEAEWQSLRDRYIIVRHRLVEAQALRQTASFRLGHLLVSATRSPRSLPRLLRSARRPAWSLDKTEEAPVERSCESSHPDRELLWRFRPEPPPGAPLYVGNPADAPSHAVLLLPHDSLAMLASSSPSALVVDSRAANAGSPWFGLGDTHRPHLEATLLAAIDLCRRRSVPVVMWWSAHHDGADWQDRFAQKMTTTVGSDEHPVAEFPIAEHQPQGNSSAAGPETADAVAASKTGSMPSTARPDRTDVVFAGHDLKFALPLMRHLAKVSDFAIGTDQWSGLSTHDAAASERASRSADTIVCEWCGPNAVWYSRNKRAGSRLIVRLHRFELTTPYIDEVDWSAVDALVVVSGHFRSVVVQRLPSLDPRRVVTIGNGVDLDLFDRQKVDGARFQIGVIGAVPKRKRLDRALDLVERVRAVDPRFSLVIKSALPWELDWVWNNVHERRFFEAVFARIQQSRLLGPAVGIDPASDDVPEWLRGIGLVLSTSDDESFHLAPAEALASAAVPIVFPWPAARSVYDDQWIAPSDQAAVETILAMADEDAWNERRSMAHSAAARYGLGAVAEEWAELIARGPVAFR